MKESIKNVLTKGLIVPLFLILCVGSAKGQVALKTNLVYDATTTPNLAAEIGIGRKHSVQLLYGLNAWTFDSATKGGEKKFKHWVLMPEYRWWTCSNFSGWFIGVHAMGGQFNGGNITIPFPGAFFSGENLRQGLKTNRYEGGFIGGGATVGYQWILGKHWNLEAEVGVGYDRVWYEKYPCAECGTRLDKASTNYIGVTKLGLCLLYIF